MTHSSANDIAALPPGVKLTTLDNSLVIIVREDHSAPVVSAQAWAMAGSIHEGRWLGAGCRTCWSTCCSRAPPRGRQPD